VEVLKLFYQISSLTAQFHHADGLELFSHLCNTVLTVLGKETVYTSGVS
jgi:hypothetical protein